MDDETVEFRVSLIASRTPSDGKKRDDGVEENFQEIVIGDKSERGVWLRDAKLLVVAYC